MSKLMKLTPENYYTKPADEQYYSASQVKSLKSCPERTIAELDGNYIREMSTALMVGQYVDEALTGDLDAWKREHPEILKRDGTLKADYVLADMMVERAKSDPVFMEYLDGMHQVIFTGEIAGYPFKCKLDCLKDDVIVDLKTVRDLSSQYLPGQGRVDFATAWDWPLQMAIYQELVRQKTGKKLPCVLAVITKETPPDLRLVQIEQERLDAELAWLENVMPRFDAIKTGVIVPPRCGKCAWCRQSRKLTGPEMLSDIEEMEA